MNIRDVPADINDRTYRFTQKAGSAQIIFHREVRGQSMIENILNTWPLSCQTNLNIKLSWVLFMYTQEENRGWDGERKSAARQQGTSCSSLITVAEGK